MKKLQVYNTNLWYFKISL